MGSYQTFDPPAENSIAVRLRFSDSQRTGGGIETKKKLVGIIVSLDLSNKRLITIPHSLLTAKLDAYGLSSSACALFKDYLSGRLQKVKIGYLTSELAVVSRGVPQRSVLGPLFSIFLSMTYFIPPPRLWGGMKRELP